jgi:hypothetical protein
MLPLAHIGHWYAEIAYVAPVVVLASWLTISGKLEQRRKRRDAADPQRDLTHPAEP